jgi:hypothetical protein
MVRISDIVGAIMRGVTMARIQSDVYSAQASQAYLKDEQLKAYPVPRTEIRQADIDLKVSILDTVQKLVDINQVALQSLIASLQDYVNTILSFSVKPTQASPDATLQPLKNYFGANGTAAAASMQALLETYLTSNIATAWPDLSASPKKYGSITWKTQTTAALNAVMTQYQVTAYTAGVDFTKAVLAAATAWGEMQAPTAQLAIDLALTSFFDLDIATKKDQIFSLPSHVMSGIKITFVVENYEWTTVKDKAGNVVNRLTHK